MYTVCMVWYVCIPMGIYHHTMVWCVYHHTYIHVYIHCYVYYTVYYLILHQVGRWSDQVKPGI